MEVVEYLVLDDLIHTPSLAVPMQSSYSDEHIGKLSWEESPTTSANMSFFI
jgi:hypothetical protein